MDNLHSKQRKVDQDIVNHPENEADFELYDNETLVQQRGLTKTKVQYRKGYNNQIPESSEFQIPESDKNIPALQESFGKPQKYSKKKYISFVEPEEHSHMRYTNNSNEFEAQAFQPNTSKYPSNELSRNDRNENERSHMSPTFKKKKVISHNNYAQPVTQTGQETAGYEIRKNASMICTAVNYGGQPVTVNNEVVRDRLVLKCRPRSYYGSRRYLDKPIYVDRGAVPQYVYPPTGVSLSDTNQNLYGKTDPDYYKRVQDGSYLSTQKPPLTRTNAIDLGLPGQYDQFSESKKHRKKKEKKELNVILCKKYTKNFKVFLWSLFIINLLLMLVGLALLLLTISHILFRDYINIVINETGFATWVWAANVLALLIIVVGGYGVVTSITRTKRMLIVYCIVAAILALLIFLFLLIFWVLIYNLKAIQAHGMAETFKRYRCISWIQMAWDELQEKYNCCGVEYPSDWTYPPSSCCNADNKFEKLACVKHYIEYEQAYKNGCRTMLQDYFFNLFVLITCLLLLALILLLLGILAALRLLKMYRTLRLCNAKFPLTTYTKL